jgi:hypothetical protein
MKRSKRSLSPVKMPGPNPPNPPNQSIMTMQQNAVKQRSMTRNFARRCMMRKQIDVEYDD